MSDRTPELGTIINEVIRRRQTEVHTSIPCKVETVDLAKGMVSVKVLIKDSLELDDGTVTPEGVPVLPNVPILWPGAGGMRLTFPVTAGDTGLLVFCERSIDAWKSYGNEVDPVDLRRHDVSDAVFQPGLRPFSNPWAGTDASYLTLGRDGGTFERNANGETLKAHLDGLKAWLDVLILPSPAGPAGPPAVASPAVPEVRSGTVKVST